MEYDEEYVAARTVLLDALEALKEHRKNIILIGAQAVYVWSGEGDFNVATMTTDADLALNADQFYPDPEVAATLRLHGFQRKKDKDGNLAQPGQWENPQGIALDLMISEHHAGTGSRAAKLPPHEKHFARRGRGLAPALVDYKIEEISAMAVGDSRSITVAVAGPAALIVAKCIKLKERLEAVSNGGNDRLKPKDALDIHRLLTDVDLDTLARGFINHKDQEDAKLESQEALEFLETQSRNPSDQLPAMVSLAAEDDEGIQAEFFIVLVNQLLNKLRGEGVIPTP